MPKFKYRPTDIVIYWGRLAPDKKNSPKMSIHFIVLIHFIPERSKILTSEETTSTDYFCLLGLILATFAPRSNTTNKSIEFERLSVFGFQIANKEDCSKLKKLKKI